MENSNKKITIPYNQPTITPEDTEAVSAIIQQNTYLTTGPKIQEFEKEVCRQLNFEYAVAVSSGTAALHCAVHCLPIIPNISQVIVPAITFAATSNAVLYEKAIPVFCDVEPDTLNISPDLAEKLITPNTVAIISVDYAGNLANNKRLREICDKHNIYLINDAAHSFGAPDVGKYAHATTFSFHAVKNITTGEGGMITTNLPHFAQKMLQFRNHGIDTTHHNRHQNLHYYDMTHLGFNYRITDFQCALGLQQLKSLPKWLNLRRNQANYYTTQFQKYNLLNYLTPLSFCQNQNHLLPITTQNHTYHLYVIVLKPILNSTSTTTKQIRDDLYTTFKNNNINVNVHYKPVYLHTYYSQLGYQKGLAPIAEQLYDQILSLPIYPNLTTNDQDRVIQIIYDFFTSSEN